MKRTQIAALILVLLVVGAVIETKISRTNAVRESSTAAAGATCPTAPSGKDTPAPSPGATPTSAESTGLPRLVDLGSTTCIPCKQMAPILEQLKAELRGKVEVQFIDITTDPKAADKYAINVIPTQIMLDGQGKELFRHEGFYPKADLLAKLRELKLLAEG